MGLTGGDIKDVHGAIVDVLDEPGSRTKDRIIEAVADRQGYQERPVEVHLSDLILEGTVVEHPQIENAWILADDVDPDLQMKIS